MEGMQVSITTFEPTLTMSTYLLAMVVCEFDFIRTPEAEQVLVILSLLTLCPHRADYLIFLSRILSG